ncbi:hypothetical protein K469DRAFT_769159 [Zopfia rhizophila CBS 207.26]|uniref:Extracellular membrane protein CFEM domain-containing protein n=1 Tax=Zopfia rhizophila CBS 207.26 TaxID=1314779 RepID=A0A6A6EE72_9PEZI|nr:hypothetical protein K469DRAFT_769159 [Zopfia rhizophila CBS 207.26]
MKLSIVGIAIWLAMALGQQVPECTRELARTDDCADVINANACYNQNRFRNAQTLQCIDGKDNADRSKKAQYPRKRGFWRPDLLTSWCRRASAAAVSASKCATGSARIVSVRLSSWEREPRRPSV